MFNKKTKGLNIIIVGGGKIGKVLVEKLSRENHNITVIDKESSVINEVVNTYDVMGVVGNGASFGVLRDAGVADADLIIAVTYSDELNLLCCTVALQFGDISTIACVRNPEYSYENEYLRSKLGLQMIITPEVEAAKEIARILSLPNALDVSSFAHGQAELVKLKIPRGNALDGLSLADIGKRCDDVLICTVEREHQFTIPSGDFRLKGGDIISFVAPITSIKGFFKSIGFKTNQVKNALVIGGGNCGYYLTKELVNIGVDVKVIERDFSRCEQLSVGIPQAVVINGSGSDEALLREEGMGNYDSVVTLTGSDEENILLTLYAKQMSSSSTKVVTRINRLTFNDVLDGLDLGSVIHPAHLTSEAIVAFVRAKSASRSSSIVAISHMFDQSVEAIEFNVDENSTVLNTPLSELKIKKNTLIAFISRDEKIIIPSGQDCIKAGDTVMIVTKKTGFVSIEDILE